MTQAAVFRATFADWKLIKTRSVVQVVFEVPLEQADAAYRVLGGMPDPGAERWCAVARLTSGASAPEDEVGAVDNPRMLSSSSLGTSQVVGASLITDKPHKPRKPVAADKRLAQQAGIMCADPVFQTFLKEEAGNPIVGEFGAAAFVRQFCGISSRAEIVPGSDAGDFWESLHGRFLAWKLAA